jgi:hypothetical protein
MEVSSSKWDINYTVLFILMTLNILLYKYSFLYSLFIPIIDSLQFQ